MCARYADTVLPIDKEKSTTFCFLPSPNANRNKSLSLGQIVCRSPATRDSPFALSTEISPFFAFQFRGERASETCSNYLHFIADFHDSR